MKNEVWEKVMEFLNQLRGEQRTRMSAVQMPGLAETEKEADALWEACRHLIERLPERERQMWEAWQEKQEELGSMQEQKAYCQGYVDCIFLLSGMGLLKQDISLEDFMNKVNQ